MFFTKSLFGKSKIQDITPNIPIVSEESNSHKLDDNLKEKLTEIYSTKKDYYKKEFMNISKCYDCGINVVKPIHISKNVLVMEFVGIDGKPEKNLLESKVGKNDYHQSLKIISDLYHKVNLVHGDFSEYNIFKTTDGLIVFDLGSAVDFRHPNSNEFLKRDISNITKFFNKRGIQVEDPEKLFKEITK